MGMYDTNIRVDSLPVAHPKLLLAPRHCSIYQTHLEANIHRDI